MGARGPAPARSDQRRRRNKTVDVDKVEVDGEVTIPEPADNWHPIAQDWFRSLAESGQSRWFEPSDWQTARYAAAMMSSTLAGERINGQLVAQVRGFMVDLLTTESARRRANIEFDRALMDAEVPSTEPADVARLDDRRKRLTDAS